LLVGTAVQMQVKVLQGIPFLVEPSTKKIYAYEKVITQPPLHLGTYDPEKETFTLLDNWQELYKPRVEAHRIAEKPRSRLPAALAAAAK
jgi:hypothetical protein